MPPECPDQAWRFVGPDLGLNCANVISRRQFEFTAGKERVKQVDKSQNNMNNKINKKNL